MRPCPRNFPDLRGFALVAVLGLLGVLAGLLLSWDVLARLHARDVRVAARDALARRNALMGVEVALGCLQRYAGPDGRVTATAEAFGGTQGTRHYTGVWDAAGSGATPLTWLVSGNEGANPLAQTPAASAETVEVLGAGTSGEAGDVRVPVVPLPAERAGPAAGHFAWWVGDEGVKAPVADARAMDGLNYPPFDAAEAVERLRQQIGEGAAATDATGEVQFEPKDPANAPLLARVFDEHHLALLQRRDGTAAVGRETIRARHHDWSVGNEAVLAATVPGGLRRDLSVRPDLLGPAFASWADYPAYMEDPMAPASPAISPAYGGGDARNSLRRRYRLTPPVVAEGIQHGVAPVLSYFLLTFNVRTDPAASGTQRPLEIRARWLVSLWNPYTSALVPESLQLDVAGLPELEVRNDTAGVTVTTVRLDSLFGAPLRISLPWTPAGRDDQQSWLPGRVYTWASQEDLNKGAAAPATGFRSVFYTRNLSTAAGQGVQRAVPAASMANSAQLQVQGTSSRLELRLHRLTSTGARETLRSFTSPGFPAFATTPTGASASTYQFTLVFRLAESVDTPAAPATWLTTAGQDPREGALPSGSFLPAANGPRPELYPNYTSISFPDRLLDRALPATLSSSTGQSYNEDTPLFELPRGPLLSMGELQHLALSGCRPFAPGNPWGSTSGACGWFDRYFFTGLGAGVAFAPTSAGPPLPNSLLRVVGVTAAGVAPTVADLADPVLEGYSSKYLLQRGAFNVNSLSKVAWDGVLRGGRWLAGKNFRYLQASAASGTSGDVTGSAVADGSATFYRFPQSAQETFAADSGYAASTTAPPIPPNASSLANTHLFRRGVRVLSSEQTLALAESITARLRERLAESGPFRSLGELLAPVAGFGGMSLLERAIADTVTADGAQLNDPGRVPEFSSQWLTQGDVLGWLAPLLFARSDTFVIRAYGDAPGPGPGRISRAWCEARIQRWPDFVDASQPAETGAEQLNLTNRHLGRRFRVASFQWLAPEDI